MLGRGMKFFSEVLIYTKLIFEDTLFGNDKLTCPGGLT